MNINENRDYDLESINIGSIKKTYNLMSLLIGICGLLLFVLGLVYTILGSKQHNTLFLGVGIGIMIGGPIGMAILWCIIKVVLGLLYDVKLLRYAIIGHNNNTTVEEESAPKINKDNSVIEPINQKADEIEYCSIDPNVFGTYVCEQKKCIIADTGFTFYLDDHPFMFGTVDSDGKGKIILRSNNRREIILQIVEDGLQAESGILYKKVASI